MKCVCFKRYSGFNYEVGLDYYCTYIGLQGMYRISKPTATMEVPLYLAPSEFYEYFYLSDPYDIVKIRNYANEVHMH